MPDRPTNKLTFRERQILQMVSTGKRSIDIAEDLGLSKHTVDNHRKKMLKKSGCRNTVEMVRWGERNGIVKA